MTKPEFKLLPCVFCTIGFNCYVAGHKIVSATYKKMTDKQESQLHQRIKTNKNALDSLRS